MIIIVIAIALTITWFSVTAAGKLGLVDVPAARKHHHGVIPLTGGIAIFLTLLLATITLEVPPYTRNMLVIAALVFMVGVYDDRTHINTYRFDC